MSDTETVLEKLGLDKLPEPRFEVPHEIPKQGLGDLVSYRQAMAIHDPIETAAFHRYLDDWIVIDQSINTGSFDPESTRAVTIPWKREIPSNKRIFRSTGIGKEPNAHNHYLWMAQEVARHVTELGARAISPPWVFRTSGAEGTEALLGVIFKVDVRPENGQTKLDIGANWALLGPNKTQAILDPLDKGSTLPEGD